MRWFHCPKTYRRKPYGCGFGPVNYTQAFSDHSFRCPKCGGELKELRSTARKDMATLQEHLDTLGFVRQTYGSDALSEYAASHRPHVRTRTR